MKRLVPLILCLFCITSSVAIADVYSLDEILPSIVTYTDDELLVLLNAITEEQSARVSSSDDEVTDGEEAFIDDTPIPERADYIERAPVQRGDKGDAAKVVQEELINLGYLTGEADGVFGAKSEAAVKLFQKANGLDETGIADSITQYVMYSENAIDKPAYDSMPIITGDGWEIVKEYYYNTSLDYYYIFILRNTSGYTAEIRANIIFYDAEDNIVGVGNGSENACESGYETYWSFSNDDIPFDHVSVEITMAPEEYYADGGQSNIESSVSIVSNKAIITAKNTGNVPVKFLKYNLLYLDEAGQIVSTKWGYLTDDDSELKPGATEMRDDACYDDFSDAKVYLLGRAEK